LMIGLHAKTISVFVHWNFHVCKKGSSLDPLYNGQFLLIC